MVPGLFSSRDDQALMERISEAQVGAAPCMRMPNLKSLPAARAENQIDASIKTQLKPTCHTGGFETLTLMNIRIGENSGTRLSTTDRVESGARMIIVKSIMGITNPMARVV